MRRQLIPQVARGAGPFRRGALLAQLQDLADQAVNLVLLAHDDLVEPVDRVFIEAGLDLQFGQALVGGVGVLHAPIGHEAGMRSGVSSLHRHQNRVARGHQFGLCAVGMCVQLCGGEHLFAARLHHLAFGHKRVPDRRGQAVHGEV